MTAARLESKMEIYWDYLKVAHLDSKTETDWGYPKETMTAAR